MARPRKDEEKDRPNRVSFRIAKGLDEGLRRLAKERNADLSDVVHELLEHGLAAEQRKIRGSANASCAAAPQALARRSRRAARRLPGGAQRSTPEPCRPWGSAAGLEVEDRVLGRFGVRGEVVVVPVQQCASGGELPRGEHAALGGAASAACRLRSPHAGPAPATLRTP